MLYEIFDIDKQISIDDIEQEKAVKNQDYEKKYSQEFWWNSSDRWYYIKTIQWKINRIRKMMNM